MAAQCNAPLRSGKRTERRNAFKLFWGFGIYILLAQRCWWGCILHKRHIWRRNIVRRYVLRDGQSEEMRLNCFGLYAINITM